MRGVKTNVGPKYSYLPTGFLCYEVYIHFPSLETGLTFSFPGSHWLACLVQTHFFKNANTCLSEGFPQFG